jgi:decaprenyl-phosphate phosphoribosyltransferase
MVDNMTNDPDMSSSRQKLLLGMLRLARPKHWIKNIFVLIPLPFMWAVSQRTVTAIRFQPWMFFSGLVGFCLINSAIYTLNDLLDRKTDRMHPKKSKRPIAAGVVSPSLAIAQVLILAVAGMTLVIATGCASAVELSIAYMLINACYSLGAKYFALLDVFLLSSGFVIRVLLGVALVGATPSSWLLICTSALALFLGFAKRRGDLVSGVDLSHRPSLRGYTLQFLNHAMIICAAVALSGYSLYSIEAKVFMHGREMASLPFVAYGTLNYLRLAEAENVGDSPVEFVYNSRSSQICAVCWIIAVLWSLGIW